MPSYLVAEKQGPHLRKMSSIKINSPRAQADRRIPLAGGSSHGRGSQLFKGHLRLPRGFRASCLSTRGIWLTQGRKTDRRPANDRCTRLEVEWFPCGPKLAKFRNRWAAFDAMIGGMQWHVGWVLLHSTCDHVWVPLSQPFCVHLYAKWDLWVLRSRRL